MDWTTLFERGAAHETDVAAVREALAARRATRQRDDGDARGEAEADAREGADETGGNDGE